MLPSPSVIGQWLPKNRAPKLLTNLVMKFSLRPAVVGTMESKSNCSGSPQLFKYEAQDFLSPVTYYP